MVAINFVVQWGYDLLLQVIRVIWGMVLLAGLIRLLRWLLAGLAFVIIAGYNLLPVIQPVAATSAG